MKWRGNGCKPGSKVVNAKGLVVGQKLQVGWLWPRTTLLSNSAAMVVILARKWPMGKSWLLVKNSISIGQVCTIKDRKQDPGIDKNQIARGGGSNGIESWVGGQDKWKMYQ